MRFVCVAVSYLNLDIRQCIYFTVGILINILWPCLIECLIDKTKIINILCPLSFHALVLKFLHGYTVILHYSLVLGPLAGGQQYIYWYDYKSLYFKILFFMGSHLSSFLDIVYFFRSGCRRERKVYSGFNSVCDSGMCFHNTVCMIICIAQTQPAVSFASHNPARNYSVYSKFLFLTLIIDKIQMLIFCYVIQLWVIPYLLVQNGTISRIKLLNTDRMSAECVFPSYSPYIVMLAKITML